MLATLVLAGIVAVLLLPADGAGVYRTSEALVLSGDQASAFQTVGGLPGAAPSVFRQVDGEPGATGGDQPLGPETTAPVGNRPENVNVSPEFLGLQRALAGEINSYRADVGGIDVALAVTDLQTGQTISVNGNTAQRTGCTINMFALLAVVGEFQAGRASPSDVAGSIEVGIGSSFPPEVRRFLQTVFDDDLVGLARAQEMMRSWGMTESVFDHVPYYGIGTQNNLLTALETNTVLAGLYRGELFDAEWTQYTLARLRAISGGLNYMLPGQLPAAATVAHKIGYYWDTDGWVNADAGIVTFTGADGKEKAYAITYLSQKAATESIGYSLAARLSAIAWEWFAAKHGVEPAPAPSPAPPATEPAPADAPVPAPTVEIAPPPPVETLPPEPIATLPPPPVETATPPPIDTATPAPPATPLPTEPAAATPTQMPAATPVPTGAG